MNSRRTCLPLAAIFAMLVVVIVALIVILAYFRDDDDRSTVVNGANSANIQADIAQQSPSNSQPPLTISIEDSVATLFAQTVVAELALEVSGEMGLSNPAATPETTQGPTIIGIWQNMTSLFRETIYFGEDGTVVINPFSTAGSYTFDGTDIRIQWEDGDRTRFEIVSLGYNSMNVKEYTANRDGKLHTLRRVG